MSEKDVQAALIDVKQLIKDQDAFAAKEVSADDIPTGDTIACLIERKPLP